VADVLGTAVINLPVDSQTYIRASSYNNSGWRAGHAWRTLIPSLLSVAMYPFTIRFPAPPVRARLPAPARACPALRGRTAR
jgi:hypothetical protein